MERKIECFYCHSEKLELTKITSLQMFYRCLDCGMITVEGNRHIEFI
jgi:DNA-directed RNA polymerase subunit RPC12/RpoP